MTNKKEKDEFFKKAENVFSSLLDSGELIGKELGDGARLATQAALSKLDVIPRHEFDAQTHILVSLRSRIEELEAKIVDLTIIIDELQQQPNPAAAEKSRHSASKG